MEIADMVKTHGVDAVVTLTLSFREFLSRKEATRRFHSLSANLLRKKFACWAWVVERAPGTGRLHYHIAGVLNGSPDVRTGFAFAPYRDWKKEQNKRTRANLGRRRMLSRAFAKDATAALREIWQDMSPANMKKYGFGMAHIVPIEKNGEAFAFYMAKYLSKPEGDTTWQYAEEDKGARSYGVCGKRRVCSPVHSPNTKRSWKWRRRVEFAARSIGEMMDGRPWTYEELSKYCGSRWCWHFKPWINDIPISYCHHRSHISFEHMAEMTQIPLVLKGVKREKWLRSEYLSFYEGETK